MKSPGVLFPSVVLAGIAVAVYLNTLGGEFTFDDNFALITNGDVSDPNKPLLALFKNDFWGQDLSSEMSHKSYRPFTILSFRLQRIVGQFFFAASHEERVRHLEAAGKHDNSRGLNPLLFHVSNVAAHAAVTVLVFRLALRLIGSRRQQFGDQVAWSTLDVTEAFVAGLLFAVHPVHTEAVAGIVGHAEMLCAGLSILALLTYMAAADGRVSNRASHWIHVGLAVLLGWSAALTKEIGITIMGMMVCYDLLVAPAIISFQSKQGTASKAAAKSAGKQRKGAAASAGPPAARQQPAAAAAQGEVGQQHGLGLKLLRLLAAVSGVVIYVKARSFLAGDQLVRIYRKVENPIPFSDSPLERKLTTGYLHSRYFGLLVAPVQLSADWSFACINYVSSLQDPRNAATLALYLFILVVALIARPWRVLAQWAGILKGDTSGAEQARRWRLAILTGLVVAPFFPASNVLFYVGTFIGERLLYFPSVGYCLLVAEWVAPPLLPLAERYREEGRKGIFGRRARPLPRKTVVAALLLATVVGLFSLKTLHRNNEWHDEERLFRAAQKVCWRSAKVQLNSGILERRYQEWDKAINHFKLAQEIDPNYCEPDYHIGVSLVSSGRELPKALDYLEKGVGCKYTAAESVKALNTVFAALTQDPNTGGAAVGMRWAKILAHPALQRYSESTHYCEQTAAIYAKAGMAELAETTLDECQDTLAKAHPDAIGRDSDHPIRVPVSSELLATLKKCLKAREAVLLEVASHPSDSDRLNSTAVKALAYRYFNRAAPECRKPLPVAGVDEESAEHQQRSVTFHMELVHMLQKADPSDPWIQREWAATMLEQRRTRDALVHSEVAGQLLRQALQDLLQGNKATWPGPDGKPLTVEAARDGALAAYRFSLGVATNPELSQGVLDQQGKPLQLGCVLKVDLCTVYDVLSRAPDGSGLAPAAVAEYAQELSRCLEEARRMGCQVMHATHQQQAQQAAVDEGDEYDEEEEEGEIELVEVGEEQQVGQQGGAHGDEL